MVVAAIPCMRPDRFLPHVSYSTWHPETVHVDHLSADARQGVIPISRPSIIFMGTPDFAVPALRALAVHETSDLVLVVTQPDRPAGRGRKLTPPPVKVAADELGIPVLQTSTLRDPAAREQIVATKPDLIVVAAFGMILGKWILDLPSRGCVNLHASILPAYRGANPISSAIYQGDTETGVTLMQMDRGLDTGDILDIVRTPISSKDKTDALTERLATLAAAQLTKHLDALLVGAMHPTPQPSGATLTRQLTKADGWIDWNRSATEIEQQIRAMWPWPRTWTTLPDGTLLQIHGADVMTQIDGKDAVGTILPGGLVRCGADTALHLERVQLAGGKPVDGNAIAKAASLRPGTIVGGVGGPDPAPPALVVPVT